MAHGLGTTDDKITDPQYNHMQAIQTAFEGAAIAADHLSYLAPKDDEDFKAGLAEYGLPAVINQERHKETETLKPAA